MGQRPRRQAESAPAAGLLRTHAILGQALPSIFIDLNLSASLLEIPAPGQWAWRPIHIVPDVSSFELAHGVESRRSEYNYRAVAKVFRDTTIVMGQHAGFHDLFVPISDAIRTRCAIVAGPFAIARPSSSDIFARWRWLTGSHGRASDPEFAHYLSMTLATVTLKGSRVAAFKRLLQCLSKLLAEQGDAERLAAEVSTLRTELAGARFADGMWEAARGIVDERTWRTWRSPWRARELSDMGANKPLEHVVVGLLISRKNEADPVDDLLRRDAFQRACVEFAKRRGGILCGRVREHGIVILSSDSGTGSRLRAKLVDVGGRVATIAKRHGLRLHLGVSAPDDERPVPARYQAALLAAEEALSRGLPVVHAEPRRIPSAVSPLGELRRQLAAAMSEGPNVLALRFGRYLEAVAVHCGYRLEPTRAHLEAGLDQIVDALRASAAADERSLAELRGTVDRAGAQANTVEELSAAYRTVIGDIERAMSRPNEARQDRSVRRAVEFIRDHLGEPLSVAKVARVAGFAPNYFSKVFVQSERMTFQRYVRELRIERAKHMLNSTAFSAERIGKLCGFSNRTHFHRAFRQSTGIAPLAYRADHG